MTFDPVMMKRHIETYNEEEQRSGNRENNERAVPVKPDERVRKLPSGTGLIFSGVAVVLFGVLSVIQGRNITAFDVIEVLIMLLCGAVYISAGRIIQTMNGNADRIVRALGKK